MQADSIARLVVVCATIVLVAAIAAGWSLAMFRDWRLAAPAKPKTIYKDGAPPVKDAPAASEQAAGAPAREPFQALKATGS